MRRLVPALLLGCACAAAGAQVLRCTDGAGGVSYTNEIACPAGTRQSGRVAEPPPPLPLSPEEARRRQDEIAAANRPSPALPAPAGAAAPGIIDSRPSASSTTDPRWNLRAGSDPVLIDDGYGYGYGLPRRAARPPQDMRPRLRDCDSAGCSDTQGNRYDRSGRLVQYPRADGSTCRTVGTTQVCR